MAEAVTSTTDYNGITEDEAALYDRQIRLWGVEAQNKMRTSSILLYTLRGLSTEIAKNIVLAGVGEIMLLDEKNVEEEDLGAGFFLREDQVGMKRVEAAAPRIQALNPRVNVKTCTDGSKLFDEEFLAHFDIIVVTEIDASFLLRINALTRKLNKKLFAAASIGMDGWVFADLLQHEFVIDKIKTMSPGEMVTVPTKVTAEYVSFDKALEHTWSKTGARGMKRITSSLWGVLTLLAAQMAHRDDAVSHSILTSTASVLLPKLGVDPKYLDDEILSRFARTVSLEFPPTTAILGGIVGQDVLNALGGKEEPIRNLMIFEGASCGGSVFPLSLQ